MRSGIHFSEEYTDPEPPRCACSSRRPGGARWSRRTCRTPCTPPRAMWWRARGTAARSSTASLSVTVTRRAGSASVPRRMAGPISELVWGAARRGEDADDLRRRGLGHARRRAARRRRTWPGSGDAAGRRPSRATAGRPRRVAAGGVDAGRRHPRRLRRVDEWTGRPRRSVPQPVLVQPALGDVRRAGVSRSDADVNPGQPHRRCEDVVGGWSRVPGDARTDTLAAFDGGGGDATGTRRSRRCSRAAGCGRGRLPSSNDRLTPRPHHGADVGLAADPAGAEPARWSPGRGRGSVSAGCTRPSWRTPAPGCPAANSCAPPACSCRGRRDAAAPMSRTSTGPGGRHRLRHRAVAPAGGPRRPRRRRRPRVVLRHAVLAISRAVTSGSAPSGPTRSPDGGGEGHGQGHGGDGSAASCATSPVTSTAGRGGHRPRCREPQDASALVRGWSARSSHAPPPGTVRGRCRTTRRGCGAEPRRGEHPPGLPGRRDRSRPRAAGAAAGEPAASLSRWNSSSARPAHARPGTRARCWTSRRAVRCPATGCGTSDRRPRATGRRRCGGVDPAGTARAGGRRTPGPNRRPGCRSAGRWDRRGRDGHDRPARLQRARTSLRRPGRSACVVAVEWAPHRTGTGSRRPAPGPVRGPAGPCAPCGGGRVRRPGVVDLPFGVQETAALGRAWRPRPRSALERYDQEHDGELVASLAAFLTRTALEAAAARLGVTGLVSHRLRKIEQLTDRSLDSATTAPSPGAGRPRWPRAEPAMTLPFCVGDLRASTRRDCRRRARTGASSAHRADAAKEIGDAGIRTESEKGRR